MIYTPRWIAYKPCAINDIYSRPSDPAEWLAAFFLKNNPRKDMVITQPVIVDPFATPPPEPAEELPPVVEEPPPPPAPAKGKKGK
jgi:hypothetical protein